MQVGHSHDLIPYPTYSIPHHFKETLVHYFSSPSSPRSTHLSNSGTKWIFFFQDTNGLAFLNLPALLGVSVTHELEVNSLAVPRMAKQVS